MPNKGVYLAYARRSVREVAAHGGRVVATGSIEPRQVMILVEWASIEAFESYRNDPALHDLHSHTGSTGPAVTSGTSLTNLRTSGHS